MLYCFQDTDWDSTLAVQYAKAMNFKVVAIDISNSQLDSVKALGADLVINSATQTGWEDKIKKTTGGGCHAVTVFSAANAAYELGRSGALDAATASADA